MNFSEFSGLSSQKVEDLRQRIQRLALDLSLIEEQFVKGSGHGGQKINKTNSCVVLRYAPLGLVVRCQRERQRFLNRFLALRELVEEIEMKISPETSPRRKAWEKIRRQKDRRRRHHQRGQA